MKNEISFIKNLIKENEKLIKETSDKSLFYYYKGMNIGLKYSLNILLKIEKK